MNIDSKEVTFSELLKEDVKYIIPEYQRRYEWTKDEIDDLIQDIENITKEKHFMGILFFCNKNNEEDSIDVVDGQQRITTIFLILNVMRDIYKSFSEVNNDAKARFNTLTQKLCLLMNLMEL